MHVNTCKYFQNIYCTCVYLYIHNKYTQYTHILYKQKLILDAINRCPALIIIQLSKRWPLSLVTLLRRVWLSHNIKLKG